MSFLGGWFDVQPGRHDEIEGIGRFVLFPLEFIGEIIEVAKEEGKDLRRSPKQRLAALEHDYRMANARQEEMKKRQGKLQKFILANKEKVKARMERVKEDFRRDYNDVKDLVKELAWEGIYEMMESQTYGKFQARVNGTLEKEVKFKEDLMQPKVIRLPEYAQSATPDFIMRKAERDKQPDSVTEEVKAEEREEVPEFVRRHKEKHGQPMEQEQEKEKEILALPDPEAKKKETSFPKAPEPAAVIEAEWEEIPEEAATKSKPKRKPVRTIEGPELV